MKRQILIIFLLLFGVGILNAAGARRAPSPMASKDPLAWLGPLPAKISDSLLGKRWDRLFEQVFANAGDMDVRSFVCKRPAEVGPVPMMSAVERYIDGAPDSRYDNGIMNDLYEAAAKGNWLARTLIFFQLNEYSDKVLQYRAVMLGEWMYERKLGQLYAAFGDIAKGSGYYSDAPGVEVTGFDTAAALHHSYVAQNDVGKVLSKNSDPELAAVGRKMLACASGSLDAYRRLFNGEAAKIREQRLQAAELATFTPLHRAVQAGNAELVAAILGLPDAKVESRTGKGQTALALALLAEPQSAVIVKLLIDHGANVASHGVVDKYASIKKTLLNLAVDAAPADAKIISMLMAAGADPFGKDVVNEYVFATPFGESFQLYESNENPAVLEQFLGSGKLDPGSPLAIEYLEHAAGYLKVLDRMIDYGISPAKSDRLVSEIVAAGALYDDKEDEAQRIVSLDRLSKKYPTLRAQLQGDAGYRNLSRAVDLCKLDLAMYFLNQGTPIDKSAGLDDGLLSTYLQHCDTRKEVQRAQVSHRSRQAFFSMLQKRNYDVNKRIANCPAWLADGSSCNLPEDDDLLKTLLNMGADPFMMYPEQSSNALELAIGKCRTAAFELMLTKAPQYLDAQALKGIELALKSTKRDLWIGLNCPADFQPKAASRLQALLVHQ